jgi:hypothetical protein
MLGVGWKIEAGPILKETCTNVLSRSRISSSGTSSASAALNSEVQALPASYAGSGGEAEGAFGLDQRELRLGDGGFRGGGLPGDQEEGLTDDSQEKTRADRRGQPGQLFDLA